MDAEGKPCSTMCCLSNALEEVYRAPRSVFLRQSDSMRKSIHSLWINKSRFLFDFSHFAILLRERLQLARWFVSPGLCITAFRCDRASTILSRRFGEQRDGRSMRLLSRDDRCDLSSLRSRIRARRMLRNLSHRGTRNQSSDASKNSEEQKQRRQKG